MRELILALLVSTSLLGQPSLRVEKGVTFQLTGETFLLDSLILEDSSTLLLDHRHSTNIIRANVISIGRQCLLQGIGNDGENGADGFDGEARYSGATGRNGRPGFSGTNLIIGFSKLSVEDVLIIDLHGGKGGTGGKGGSILSPNHKVSGISKTTAQYSSEEQPRRGLGGNGGDGGNGGELTISYLKAFVELVNEKINVNNKGGIGGKSGTPEELKVPPWFFENERNGANGSDGVVKLMLIK